LGAGERNALFLPRPPVHHGSGLAARFGTATESRLEERLGDRIVFSKMALDPLQLYAYPIDARASPAVGTGETSRRIASVRSKRSPRDMNSAGRCLSCTVEVSLNSADNL
jgi:hypothetical protein